MLKAFAVFDSKAEAFMPPFFVKTDGLAIRIFTERAHENGSPFNKFPGDFTLFGLGEFDEQKGLMIQRSEGNYNLGTALNYLALERMQNGSEEHGE